MPRKRLREKVIYRSGVYGELLIVSAFIASVFNHFVAPDYDPQGTHEFLKYIHPTAIGDRLKHNHFLRVAEVNQQIVGVLEMRDYHHLSLLFVARSHQRQGIAKKLFSQAIAICQQHDQDLAAITVNSAPGAVPAYQAMHFQIIGEEQVKNGIRFIPMQYELKPKSE